MASTFSVIQKARPATVRGVVGSLEAGKECKGIEIVDTKSGCDGLKAA